MAGEHKILVELKKCMRDAKGNQAAMDACEVTFVNAGGKTSEEGGKVFIAPDGSQGYVTKGGKVF